MPAREMVDKGTSLLAQISNKDEAKLEFMTKAMGASAASCIFTVESEVSECIGWIAARS